jgi:plasmid stabilization system protein ParE
VKIKLTKRAERRIEIVDHYWRTHRLEAPDSLKQELSGARLRLAQDPYAGAAVVLGGKHSADSSCRAPSNGSTMRFGPSSS